jgi:hypothetical protein
MRSWIRFSWLLKKDSAPCRYLVSHCDLYILFEMFVDLVHKKVEEEEFLSAINESIWM